MELFAELGSIQSILAWYFNGLSFPLYRNQSIIFLWKLINLVPYAGNIDGKLFKWIINFGYNNAR